MSSNKYAVGVEFDTKSGRAVLVEVGTSREIATAVHPYANGVILYYAPLPQTPFASA